MTSNGSARSVTVGTSQLNYLQASTLTANSFSDECTEEASTITEETTVDVVEDEESSEDSVDYAIDWGPSSSGPDLYLPGAWGTQGLEEHPWDDTKRPVVTFRNYKDLELNQSESGGVLSDRIMASCSTYLDKSPESGKYVLCKMVLSKKSLVDIRVLGFHHHIQYLDLSWNHLKNVEALGQLPFLMYLDLSHNQMETILDFKAPLNLTYVNYSYNTLSSLRDISDFWSIVYLDLSHNYIESIIGLQELRFLRHLNLSHNAIRRIENLNNMKLLNLNLQNNKIESYEEGDDVGFKTLNYLLQINLDYNELKSLKVFDGIPTLQSLKIRDNYLTELMELTALNQLNFLTEVDFRGNPIVDMDQYLEVCIKNVRRITILDGEFVNPEKKMAVQNKFDPSLYTAALKSAATSLFLQHLNDPVLGVPIVPFDNSYVPIIVLVGTPGSNKTKLLKQFCELHPKHVIMGVSHTTRPQIDDTEKNTYYFTSSEDFWQMAHDGEFLTVSQIFGHSFGFSQKEFGKTVGQPCALVLHMDMKGALTLRAKNSKTQLVLAMPSTREIHTQFICEKYYNEQKNASGGATLVVNCPEKAQDFLIASEYIVLNQNTKNSQLRGDFANTGAPEELSETGEEIYSEKSSRKSRFNTLNTILLCYKHRRKATSSTAYSTYPTFQTRAGSSRSVTFLDGSELNYTKGSSISETVIDENEPLSVLSKTFVMQKKEATTTVLGAASDVWTTQTDALKAITTDILKMRETYLHFHSDNPGLFSEVIFTDEESTALTKLTNLLKNCIIRQPNVASAYQYKQDSAYQAIIATRLKCMHTEINSEMSLGQKQLNENKFYTPKGRQFTSQLKKSKKEIIDTMASNRKSALRYKLPKDVKLNRKTSSIPSIDL
ncbi:hypothetical protein RN001_014080 [Aquatica leii]|uniref:Dynein axonemal assembly factor 1 homolog n=1 Tax=Aquatica leii TaxID=1421715 RepID=A0AAN7NX13_9COLE|nr:hypothetical protein RN001_014080 [Aquatica leii]